MYASVYPSLPVLVVDDDEDILSVSKAMLGSFGINNIILCDDSREVMNILSDTEVGIILLDLSMPYITGDKILSKVTQQYPGIQVFIITGTNEVATAVKCMKEGAFDYMVKPVEKCRLVSGIKRAIELQDIKNENDLLRQSLHSDTLKHPEAFSKIVTKNPIMLSIFRYVETIANTSKPVLITGETGTGKELISKSFHIISGLNNPFISVNVAGLDDNMFSDTLFGHTKGAFTGAIKVRKGLIEKASEGILFLDEIGDLNMASQIKLLRLLQNREYMQLGSDVLKKSNARVIVSTNRDLEALQKSGTFRKDLYYRLRTHHVHLPLLRDRICDIPLLIDYFLEKASLELGKKKPTPPQELKSLLTAYSFPGNIRELESMVFEAVSCNKSRILSMEVFKSYISKDLTPNKNDLAKASKEELPLVIFPQRIPSLREVSNYTITEAMRRANGNQTIAAKFLGISQQALSKRLKLNNK